MAENIRPYIIINGKTSMEVSGLLITKLPPITKPQMRVTAEEIDGRDGDIVTELGFSAYDKDIEIGLVGDYDVNDVIEYFNQSGIITFSNEPDKYYKFAQYDGIDFDKLIRFKKAKVSFHVQPFKFETDENDVVVYSPTSFNVTNEGNIYSKPEIALQGSGNVGISLNGSQALSINLGDTKQAIVIDSNDMNAYGTKSNIKELITEINPVQDLHGYSHPWIGGAGKNKLNNDGYFPKNASISNTYYYDFSTVQHNLPEITLQADTTYTLSLEINTNVTPFNFSVGCGTGGYSADIKAMSGFSNGRISITFTPTTAQLANGNILAFRAPRYSSLTSATFTISNVQLELGSTATSFEPYENICPILGWNGSVITRCGTNIWDGEWVNGQYNSSGVLVSDQNYISCKNLISCKPETLYYWKAPSVSPNWIYFYDKDRNKLPTMWTGVNYTFETPSNCYYMAFTVKGTTYNNNISINYPSTDHDYHAYVGSKYQTYFEGLMAGTYGFVDLGSLTWEYYSDGLFYTAGLRNIAKINGNLLAVGYTQSPVPTTNPTDKTMQMAPSGQEAILRMVNKEFSDAEAFTEAMSGIHLIYELATPTTPTITQENINMLVSEFNADLVCVVFGQEVYGAHLNVTTGLLTITHAMTTVNDAISNRTTSYSNPVFYGSINGLKPQTNNILSECFNVISGKPSASSFASNSNNGDFAINSANTGADIQVFLRCDDYDDVTSLKNALGTTAIVYELATPIEIQLSGQDLMTLIGKNNIMSNTGAISECIYTHAGADITTSGEIVTFDVDVGDIKDNILKNRIVTGNYDNLKLKIGTNQIGVSGDVDVIVLSNVSRWL